MGGLGPTRFCNRWRTAQANLRLLNCAFPKLPHRANPPSPPPLELANELGLIQITHTGATEAWVDRAFRENDQAVRDAIGNPKKAKKAAGFLRGQVMKLSGGKADPKLVGELIEKRLSEKQT